jgi:hypothetical protein
VAIGAVGVNNRCRINVKKNKIVKPLKFFNKSIRFNLEIHNNNMIKVKEIAKPLESETFIATIIPRIAHSPFVRGSNL